MCRADCIASCCRGSRCARQPGCIALHRCRAALAAKEAELQDSQHQLAAANGALAALPAQFAEATAVLEADRRQVDSWRREREGEAAGLAQAQEEGAADCRAAAAATALAAQQLEEAAAAEAAAVAEAAAARARAELVRRAAAKMDELRSAEETVQQRAAEAGAAAAQVQARARELAGARAKLQHELGVAEGSAAAAR